MENRTGSSSWAHDGATPPVTQQTTAQEPVSADVPDNGSQPSPTYGQDRSYLYPDERGDHSGYPYGGSGYPAGTSPAGHYGDDAGYPPRVPPPASAYPAPGLSDASDSQTPGGRTAVYGSGLRTGRQAASQPRRANLVIARLEPWSVMKFSFLMSLVAWLVLFVAVALIYFFLSQLGVFASLQHTLESVTSSQSSAGVQLSNYVSASKVLGYTMLLGAINVVLITALSTVGAMIYNLVTRLGAGIEVTLRESD